ncbi:MAG: hypothetical protein M1837_005764 [Sclerophora amabilis]|nr:MAG: hypothetical protein M1837_005764 [Sclerophora amabilis]
MGMLEGVLSSSNGGTCGSIFRWALRVLQFVLALAVAGLYGTDLNNARKHELAGDPKWIYAVVVAGLSALTTLVYLVPFVKSYFMFGWDAILFLLWMVVFGTFGKMFIEEDPEGDGGIQRMKNAVWVDLVNMVLWFITAVYGGFTFSRRRRTQFSPRATV